MRFFLLFLMIFFNASYGSVIGTGTASVGISKFKHTTEYGADLDYQLKTESLYQKTQLSLYSEYTSSDTESSLYNDHSQLYGGDLTSISIQNSLPIYSSLITWNTDSNFESRALSFVSDESEDWYWDTGPDITKYIRRDFIIEAGIKSGESDINGLLSNNTESNFIVTKILSNTTSLNLIYNYLCWDYRREQQIDNCRAQYGLSLNIMTRNSVVDLDVGQSVIDDTASNTYSLKFNYKINSKDSLSIDLSEEVGNLKSRLDIFDIDGVNPAEITTESKKIEYMKIISRTSISLFYEESEYRSDQTDDQNEKISSAKIKYELGEGICRSCDVIFTRKNNTINELSWYMNAIGMEYPISRNMLLNVTLRHSKDEVLGEYNSLNLQVRYNGMDQKLGLN